MGSFFDATEIATQVIELVGGLASAYISYELLTVAEDYYKIYKTQREFYYDTFQNRLETPLAAELFGVPIYNIDYAGRVATAYDVQTGPFGGESTNALGWWTRHAAMYNDIPDPYISELAPDMAKLKSDWANYLFRYEEYFKDIMDDIRWNGRLLMHNIGLKQNSAISAALSTSFKNYEDELNDTADVFATLANGAAAYRGYKKSLSDTADDFTQHGYRHNKNNTARNPTLLDDIPVRKTGNGFNAYNLGLGTKLS